MHLSIAHLYGDIMNTYGDWGNILALIYRCQRRDIEVSVTTISIDDAFDPKLYDFYFFGGGQDKGQEVVAADLPRLVAPLREAVESEVPLLSVCGGYQLLGHSYTTGDGTVMPGAEILPVDTKAGSERMMHNLVVAINPQLELDRTMAATLVGFENHSGQTFLQDTGQSLGRVVKGSGNNGSDGTEGVVYKAAIGTYLHGSCLPKNPHLADWLLQKALQKKYGQITLEPLSDALEWQAHRAALRLPA